jgi:hypothetical protein
MLCRSILTLLLATLSFAQAAPKRSAAFTPEQRTARYFDSIKNDPVKLRAFLRAFPKGGDLHNHLSGAVYAENYIQWATEMGLCATKEMALVATKQKDVCDDPQQQRPVSESQKDARFYNSLIDAFSMRNWDPAREPGEYHFFAAFGKFGPVSGARRGDMLAEVMHRAASENTLYLELLLTIDRSPWVNAAKAVGWPTASDNEAQIDFADLHKKLLAAGIAEAAGKRSPVLDEIEARARQLLRCDLKGSANTSADVGCGITVRYQSEVYRLGAPENVFAQLIWGFELAKHDPRVVAVNLVQPEDGLVAMRDYDLHMRMLDYLHKQYPEVHIALHAGELGFGQVPPTELGTHIAKAIDTGHAERIGHGTDIMFYSKPDDLMKEMADKHIAVEISPSSSDLILGIKGTAHPLRDYVKAGVPVVISTDDAGVARSDLTNEYMRAVMESGLGYEELKKASRLSIEYSFLSGERFTRGGEPAVPKACESDSKNKKGASQGGACAHCPPPPLGPPPLNSVDGLVRDPEECLGLVSRSEAGTLQWRLEQALAKFERAH